MGYFSDITRTFSIGNIDPEFINISKIVLAANEAGRSTAMPGIPAEKVDHATRSVIETAGYGKFFTHRTGHGVGMEAHESPYIRSGNPELLEPGMTFTVEPGIYLPGRNGVRIEDDVVITHGGAESLTDFPREVRQLI
jgi:Xaa-Pro aminopeptidase